MSIGHHKGDALPDDGDSVALRGLILHHPPLGFLIQIAPGIPPVVFFAQRYSIVDFAIPKKLDYDFIRPVNFIPIVSPDL